MTLTATQLAMLVLALIAGWLFGLASHSGGAKWRDRYNTERDAHAAARRDADTRVAEANRRATDAEGERDRLARAAPVTAQTVAPNSGATVVEPVTTTRVEPIRPISSTTVLPPRRDPV